MPDRRTHRGAHPQDKDLFSGQAVETLKIAAGELCWLLNRGYAVSSTLKLVGDRYHLTARQRSALQRSVCRDDQLESRRSRCVEPVDLQRAALRIDGFNTLLTVEAAFGGAIVLRGRDGCYRDLAGVHGSYRSVEETVPAIESVGECLALLGVSRCHWYLDRPISNSGRLKSLLLEYAERQRSDWEVDLVYSPDFELKQPGSCVATADAGILDSAGRWFSLSRFAIDRLVPNAWIIDLFASSEPSP